MNLKEAHEHSSDHRAEVQASQRCGCFYCRDVYPAASIKEWIGRRGGVDNTALCPLCGIDAVLGDASGLPVADPAFLQEMYDRFFKGGKVCVMKDGKVVEEYFVDQHGKRFDHDPYEDEK